MTPAVELVLIGLGIAFVYFWWHDSGPHPDGKGEWAAAPSDLARFVRRGHGPVLIGSLTAEVVGLALIGIGTIDLLIGADLVDRDAFIVLVAAGTALILAVWGVIEVRARLRRR